jgi:alpha-galactosidase
MGYRPDTPAPVTGFQGEGLLALEPGDGGPVRLWAAPDATSVPSIRAELVGDRVVVRADGAVAAYAADTIAAGLATFGDTFAGDRPPPRPAPTVWCSWYQYFADVSEQDIVENLDALSTHDLPVDVVQIDDGWSAGIGDWLHTSDRFSSLPDLVRRIHDSGRRAGIWVAPFLATAGSAVARDHPDWFLGPAGHNWNDDLLGLDTTHPDVAGYLTDVFTRLRSHGFDYFKVDFLYAAARPGPRHDGRPPLIAYRSGLELIRAAIGPEAYLLGCGAPILPSVGLVDAMRVSPDIALTLAPTDGDLCLPSLASATQATVGRAWQHGRFWVNDPDCIVARPGMPRRESWAATVGRFGGLRASSDRIAALDDWGLATTRRLLATVPPPTPF